MKIIVTEYVPAKGHRNLFLNVCNLLRQGGADVVAVVPNNYEDKIPFCKIINHGYDYYSDVYQHSSMNMIKYSLRVQYAVKNIAKSENADAILVVTYDELSLALGRVLFFGIKPQIVIQNINVDRIEESRVRKIAFNFFKNSVSHIVLAGFIKEHMVGKLSISQDKVLVIPHPMFKLDKKSMCDIDLVGLSNGNDEEVISSIVEMEKQQNIFSKNNMHVVLKSRLQSYDNGFLTIVKGFIPDETYSDLMIRAKCIFAPYPLTYKNRMSAILVDAMANNKSVIGMPIPVLINAASHYPHSIRLFNIDTFVKDIKELGTASDAQNNEFKEFQDYRDESVMARLLTEGVANMLKESPVADIYDF